LPHENIAYIPSRNLYPSKSVVNAARLNFTGEDVAAIQTGAARLSAALAQAVVQPATAAGLS
jgi:hypothetical protein